LTQAASAATDTILKLKAMPRQPQTPEQRARTAVARLELVSHGGTSSWDSSGSASAERPHWPGGGVAKRDDREEDFPQRSHLAFRGRLDRCRTDDDWLILAKDAEAAHLAWQVTPAPSGGIPPWNDVAVRNAFIVENPQLGARALAKHWGVTHPAILKIRKKRLA
jgi:hypothetical protein